MYFVVRVREGESDGWEGCPPLPRFPSSAFGFSAFPEDFEIFTHLHFTFSTHPGTTTPPPPPSKTKKMMRLQIMMHPSRLRHFPVGQSPTSVVLTVAGLTGSTHPLHSLAAKHS